MSNFLHIVSTQIQETFDQVSINKTDRGLRLSIRTERTPTVS